MVDARVIYVGIGCPRHIRGHFPCGVFGRLAMPLTNKECPRFLCALLKQRRWQRHNTKNNEKSDFNLDSGVIRLSEYIGTRQG